MACNSVRRPFPTPFADLGKLLKCGFSHYQVGYELDKKEDELRTS
jgi:hypothetical protein